MWKMVEPKQKEALGVGRSPWARLWQSEKYSWGSQDVLLNALTIAVNSVLTLSLSEMHLEASGCSTACSKNKDW